MAADPLATGEVQVWRVYWPHWVAQLPKYVAVLSADESARAERFRQVRDRHRYILGRSLLRHILSRYTAIPPAELQFFYGDKGKPHLAASQSSTPLAFNLSHSEDWILYAVAQHPVGIDLEAIRPIPQLDSILQRFFAPSEQQMLSRLPPAEKELAFFRCWTAKEAFLKAIGLGLGYGLESVAIALTPQGTPQFQHLPAPNQHEAWSLHAIDVAPGYAAALAVAAATITVQNRTWPPDSRST